MKSILFRSLACLATCSRVLAPVQAAEIPSGAAVPSFRELEREGATIGRVRVDAANIFDLSDPREDNWIFRLVNALHIGTRPAVIERVLLFKTGDRVSQRVIDETERLLRANRFLYDVDIRPAAYHDGVVDIDVVTRDTWTIDFSGQYSRSGGANTSRFGIKDYNFLGTALRLGISHTSNTDRHGSEYEVSYPQAFDGWTSLSYLRGVYDDGSRTVASVARPFYALDTRWAAGASWDDQKRIDSIYNAGDVVSQFRHHAKVGEAYAGWSPGLVGGLAQRYSAGVAMQDDSYALDPNGSAPAAFPVDNRARGPFVRYEVVEDRFVKMRNRDQIARTEFVALGFNSRVEVIRALEGWGATHPAWLYSAAVSNGFSFSWGHDLLAAASAERRVASTGGALTQYGASLRYYAPQSTHAAFYGALAGDRVNAAMAPDQLLLGGDNGLRGYPLRYQSGEQRVLLTLEQRGYTDWYPFRLLRVGGAVFYDVGRAWGGVNQNAVNGGWLSDVGIGLRLSLDRTAFANVLHADIAVPLDRAAGIKSVQYLVKTQLTF
jgi:hypothetical protein